MRTTTLVVVFMLLIASVSVYGGELPADQQRQFEYEESLRLWMLELQPSLRYQPDAVVSACGNGDFEIDIATSAEWEGAYGSVQKTSPPQGNGEPDFAKFTAGLVGGPLNSSNSRQTWVAAGVDPVVGISQVAPTGSTHAVRIGNVAAGYGSELLSKTFVVPASTPIIRFWYAAVFHDPERGHANHERPAFSVRVLDAGGNEIHGVTDLGNGTPKVVSSKDPFFTVKPNTSIVYRDWSCAQIDLRDHVGETVTVQFVTEDCSQGAHWGYAYIDDYCGNCSGASGFIAHDLSRSATCGRGQLCFDYGLPAIGATTGSVVITLSIAQNGNAVTLVPPLTSGPLTSGNKYCFAIDPASIQGLSPGSFVVTATGLFTITTANGTSQYPLSADPVTYDYACGNSGGCCPGPNLIANGDFESGNSGFTSDYPYVPSPGAVLPGQYAIVNSAQASAVSSAWNVQNHGSCSTTGKVLIVNGETGKSGSRRVWSQTVPVTPGREYRFCASFRNLPQCALDVKPEIEVRFSVPSTVTSSVVNTNATNGCDWTQETHSVVIPGGVTSLTTEIWLDETGAGDGNDLALDDLSLHEMQKANPNHVLVNIASSNLTTTSYNITATPAPQTLNYYWEVCEVDSSGICIPATQVQNPSAWWILGANDFKGYAGSSVLGPLGNAGIFDVGKKYRITYGVFDLCTSFTSSSWYFSFNINTGRVEVEPAVR
ncbi:MAG: hypothetical protein ACXW5U_24085 [Thermoanaerobaculia bacterium]